MTNIMLTGYLSAVLGIGEVARRLATSLFAAGFDLELIDLQTTKSRSFAANFEQWEVKHKSPKFKYVSVVNPDQFALTSLLSLNPRSKPDSAAGVWSWELEKAPNFFNIAAKSLDEIWTYSDFMVNCFENSDEFPKIQKFNLHARPFGETKERSRATLGLQPKDFLCSVVFDFFSDVKRKNPWASVSAYLQAFPKEGNAKLAIKTINSEYYPEERLKLLSLIEGRNDIKLIEKYLSEEELRRVINASNVHISLHRSEGFGINLFDALSDGVPVVATGYSGNLEYMKDFPELLVPFDLVNVQNYAGYKLNAQWAEPDVKAAALSIRKISSDATFGGVYTKYISTSINSKFSLHETSKALKGAINGFK